MDKKKILIVSASFHPQNSPRSFRTTELAKEFSRQGHDVTVYIPTNGMDYTPFESEHKLKIKSLGALRCKPIAIKGGKIQLLVRRLINRGMLMLFEWPDIELMFKIPGKLKAEIGYDLLISIAVPHPVHWGVAKARGKVRRIAGCWVADCGDPYMAPTTDSFRKLFYFKYLEKWFCRTSDYISVPFNGAKSAYYPEFQDKIKVIPQGFHLDDLRIPEYRKDSDYAVFAYAGSFIPGKRDPRPTLEFLSTLKKKFKFVIYTSQKEIPGPFKRILEEKLEILEIIPRKDLLVVLATMDFLINFDNNVTAQLPSKLIDYSISGRPVLNIKSEEDFPVLAEFLEGNYSRRMNLEPAINYDIKTVAEKFLQLQSNI